MWEAQCGEGPVEESAQGRGLHEGPLLYQTATSVTCLLSCPLEPVCESEILV